MLYNLALPPGVILITLTPFIVAAGLYGLVHGFRRPLGRDFCFLLLLMAAALAYQIIAGGLLPMARYTITVGTLLVIASGLGLHRIAHALPQWGQLHFRGTLAALLVLNLGSILAVSEIHNSLSDKFSAISPRLRFPRPIEGLRQYLKPKVDPDAAIAIDNYNTESNIIASAIGLPLIARSNTFLASSRSLSELPEYMRAREQFYVIYSDKGVFRNAFLLPKVCGVSAITVNGLDFKCLFANETYRVYRVSRAESNNRIVSTQGQGQLNPL